MKKYILKGSFFIFCFFIGSWIWAFNGNVLPQNLELKKLKKLEFISIVDSIIEVKITAKFNNPNHIGAKVKKLDLKVFFEDIEVGIINEQLNWKIKANDSIDLTLISRVNLAKLAKVFPSMMLKDSIFFNIKGAAYANVLFFKFELPIDVTEKFSFKKEIEHIIAESMNEQNITIESIQLPKFSFTKIVMKTKINFQNNFNIPYELKEINFQFYLKNQKKMIGSALNKKTIIIKEQENVLIPIVIAIKNKEILTQIGSFFFNKKEIEFDGFITILLGGYRFKVVIKHKVDLIPKFN